MRRIIWVVLLATACGAGETAFKQAIEPRRLIFPRDHASHAGFQTEWWYVTGNVQDESGGAFGYQFTIFRRAMSPRAAAERGRKSAWAIDDIYLGHLAVSDPQGRKFHFDERAQRGVLGLAGATDAAEFDAAGAAAPAPRVWLGSWEMLRTRDGWNLRASGAGMELDFELTETLAPVCHGRPGEEGLSRKGPRPGQASYYYSVPQLKTRGTLKANGHTHKIASGRSWMDHEFGSNQLVESQAGWDWFSVQLDGGGALMLYLLRNQDGSLEPSSSGTWIAADGSARHIALQDVSAQPGRVWSSPFSGGRYAVEWRVEIPKFGISLEIQAAQDDQEVKTAKLSRISYYEGAISVRGTINGAAVKGDGYLEITGAPGQKTGAGRGLGGVL